MILYFSGTGNSKYCAEFLAEKLDDEIISINDRIRNSDNSSIESNKPFVIVCPIYAWRIPRLVSEWIKSVKFIGNEDFYFVTTCGSEAYSAGKYLKKLCDFKDINYKGIAEVIMPGNYIIMFDSPTQNEIDRDYENAPKVLSNIAYYIKNLQSFPDLKTNIIGDFMSGVVNAAFYPMFVNDKKFQANDKCIACGKCAKICPLNNIDIVDNNPIWKGNCTQCMACISNCPVGAIEYGNATKGKNKYICKL